MDIDTFAKLPVLWKTVIVVGFITLLIICILIVVLIFVTYYTPKLDMETNLDEFKDFLDNFDNEEVQEPYPKLPIIKDLNGEPLKDSLDIIPHKEKKQ